MTIIIFLWFFILPVVGWAREVIGPIPNLPGVHPDNVGKCFEAQWAPVGQWGSLKEIPCGETESMSPEPHVATCYQRMQEAIGMVQTARDHEGKNITYIIDGVEYTRWSLTEPQRHLWLDVVGQCVEGKP